MHIVIAPDSFKESLSAVCVARAMARGVREVLPDAVITCIPMADGGEGSLDAVLAACAGERRSATVSNANNQPIQAQWGWLENKSAFIEIAAAAGLAQIPVAQRNALTATSYGVGQLILQALDAGAKHITLGLGGSACNDGGAGMLQALGAKLLDKKRRPLPLGGAALAQLEYLLPDDLDPRLQNTVFKVASDVANPLCGPDGASAVFGPQKGATPDQVAQLDAALLHFAKLCAVVCHNDERNAPGAGAAGGLGFGIKTFLNASFSAGVDLFAELLKLPQAMDGADLVLTGEGRLDAQTIHGKTPAGVARYAQARGLPVIAIAGSLGEGYEALYGIGISAAFSITPGPMTLEQAYAEAPRYIQQRTSDSLRLWLAAFNQERK